MTPLLTPTGCANVLSAAFTGLNQCRLIDFSGFHRLHQSMPFRIIPDIEGVILNGGNSERLRYRISSFTPRAASRGTGSCSGVPTASSWEGELYLADFLIWNVLSRDCGFALSGAASSALEGGICGVWPHPSLCPPACSYPGPQSFPGVCLSSPHSEKR